jgi:hypothetical protein
MMSDSAYSLGTSFVSLNSYLCIEINAHALILLIIRLGNRKELFKPWLCGSQSCESYFRTARSCTPTESTQVTHQILKGHRNIK